MHFKQMFLYYYVTLLYPLIRMDLGNHSESICVFWLFKNILVILIIIC